MTTDSIYS